MFDINNYRHFDYETKEYVTDYEEHEKARRRYWAMKKKPSRRLKKKLFKEAEKKRLDEDLMNVFSSLFGPDTAVIQNQPNPKLDL